MIFGFFVAYLTKKLGKYRELLTLKFWQNGSIPTGSIQTVFFWKLVSNRFAQTGRPTLLISHQQARHRSWDARQSLSLEAWKLIHLDFVSDFEHQEGHKQIGLINFYSSINQSVFLTVIVKHNNPFPLSLHQLTHSRTIYSSIMCISKHFFFYFLWSVLKFLQIWLMWLWIK